MFRLESKGEVLIFMSRHFDETMTILISHFLLFGALKIVTGDYFVLRINQTVYSKPKIGCFIRLSIFLALFLQQFFPFTLAYKWRMDRIRYQQVNVKLNINWFYLVLICDSIISPHLCIATKCQRSLVCGKLILSNVVLLMVKRGSIGTLNQLPRNSGRCGVVGM